jgi:hypothetical protein
MSPRPFQWHPVVIGYALLCLAALAYILISSSVTGGKMELGGVLIVILGLPWSIILVFGVIALGSSSAWLLAIVFLVSCVINGTLLYRFTARRQRD